MTVFEMSMSTKNIIDHHHTSPRRVYLFSPLTYNNIIFNCSSTIFVLIFVIIKLKINSIINKNEPLNLYTVSHTRRFVSFKCTQKPIGLRIVLPNNANYLYVFHKQ